MKNLKIKPPLSIVTFINSKPEPMSDLHWANALTVMPELAIVPFYACCPQKGGPAYAGDIYIHIAHHAVSPQQQRRDLADWRRVAVVVAGQVAAATASVGHAVLAVVAWTENPVEAEQQQDQQDPGSQAQSCHPGGGGGDGGSNRFTLYPFEVPSTGV